VLECTIVYILLNIEYNSDVSPKVICKSSLPCFWEGRWVSEIWGYPGSECESYYHRILWPCIVNIRWREGTNKVQLIRRLLSNFYLKMFRASLCPSSGEQDRVLLHAVFCTGCVGCGWLWSGAALCTVWQLLIELSKVTVLWNITPWGLIVGATTAGEYAVSFFSVEYLKMGAEISSET